MNIQRLDQAINAARLAPSLNQKKLMPLIGELRTQVTHPAAIHPGLKRAVELYFLAMVYEQSIAPIVNEYKCKVLADMGVEWRDRSGEIIFKDDQVTKSVELIAWLMSDADSAIYCDRIADEAIKAGLTMESRDYCPLFVANWKRIKAARSVLEVACATIPAICLVNLDCLYGDNYDQLLDMVIGLVVSLYPNIKNDCLELAKECYPHGA